MSAKSAVIKDALSVVDAVAKRSSMAASDAARFTARQAERAAELKNSATVPLRAPPEAIVPAKVTVAPSAADINVAAQDARLQVRPDVKDADTAVKTLTDLPTVLPKHEQWLAQNPAAQAIYDSKSPQEQKALISGINANLASGKYTIKDAGKAAVALGAGAAGAATAATLGGNASANASIQDQALQTIQERKADMQNAAAYPEPSLMTEIGNTAKERLGQLSSGVNSVKEAAAPITPYLAPLNNAYDYFEKNIQQPIAGALARGVQVPENSPALFSTSYEQSEAAKEPNNPGIKAVADLATDPTNYMGFEKQLAVGAARMLAPEESEQRSPTSSSIPMKGYNAGGEVSGKERFLAAVKQKRGK